MSERNITFNVDAEVGQAQVKLDAVQTSFEDGAGAAKKMGDAVDDAAVKTKKIASAVEIADARVDKLTREIVELATATAGGAKNSQVYAAELKRLHEEMDRLNGRTVPAEKQIQKLNSAQNQLTKSSGNVGRAMLDVSRAVEDAQYGFAGVLNNLPGMVANFGGPAGLAAAVSLTAVAGFTLYKNWDLITAAFGSSDLVVKQTIGVIKDLGDAFDKDLNKRMQEGRDRLQSLKDELRDFGLSSRDKSLEEEYRGLEDLEKRRDSIAKNRRFLQAKANAAESARNKAEFAISQAVLDETDRRAKAIDASIAATESRIIAMNRTAAAIRTKEAAEEARAAKEKGGKRAAKTSAKTEDADAKLRHDLYLAELNAEDDALRAVAKARAADAKAQRAAEARDIANDFKAMDKARRDADREAERAARLHENRLATLKGTSISEQLAFDTIATDMQMANLDRLSKHEFMLLTARRNAVASFYDDLGGLAQQGFGVAIGASQDYIKARIEGDKLAEIHFATSIMAQAGQALIASGTKLGGEAIVSAFTPGLQPLAVAQAAAAAGLIGTGLSLGGVAAGLNHQAAGGTVGKAIPRDNDSRGRSDPGAPPRRSGGGSGGATNVFNISFGVGGPLPEDIGRELAKQMRTSDRRGVA